MGFMDKLKNIFFEEEEDEEIEDTIPPKKEKKEKEKIARKIEFPSIKKEEKKEEIKEEIKEEQKKVEIETPRNEIKKEEPKKIKVNTELIFDDDDFIFDSKPEVKQVKPKVETPPVSKKVEPIVKKEIKPIEKKEKYEPPKETYKYTKKVETKTKTFTPSPIISPIYGILDKNYKKEEVKENKEIRLTSRPSKVDFDSVRNKAFGDLEYDLFEDVKEETKVVEPKDIVLEEEKRERNKKTIERIYQKDEKPSIDKVTIGEADEYYNDLGLAYNTDYKDLSKDQSDGKVEKEKNKENNLEDNLFDLIESMYDREE